MTMPNDTQSRAELVLIPFAYCCGSVDVAACDCASPNHGTALVSSVSNALAQTLSGVDAVDLGMLKRGDLLGSEVGAAIYTAIENQASRIEALEAENARLREALTPSGDTKADYMGEFSFGITLSAGGEEDYRRIMVPWTTIKEIMAAILARSALTSERPKE